MDKMTLSSGQETGSWKMQVLLFLKLILMSLPVSGVPTLKTVQIFLPSLHWIKKEERVISCLRNMT